MTDPFAGRTEISAEEYLAYVNGQAQAIPAARAEPPDWLTKEKAFRQKVVNRAGELGWRCYWTWNSAHSPAGFPDLICVRPDADGGPGRLIAAELKLDGKRPTQLQKIWLEELADCGVESYVWHPSDWSEIERVLA